MYVLYLKSIVCAHIILYICSAVSTQEYWNPIKLQFNEEPYIL